MKTSYVWVFYLLWSFYNSPCALSSQLEMSGFSSIEEINETILSKAWLLYECDHHPEYRKIRRGLPRMSPDTKVKLLETLISKIDEKENKSDRDQYCAFGLNWVSAFSAGAMASAVSCEIF